MSDQNQTPSFQDIVDPSQPSVKTLDPQIMKIGDQLEVIARPAIPDGVPQITDEQKKILAENQSQISWLLMGLLLTFLFQQFFRKRGR